MEIAQGRQPEPSMFRVFEVVNGERILKGQSESDFPLDIEVISRREDVRQS